MATATLDGIETRYEVLGAGPALLMFSPGGFDATVEKWSTLGVYARIKPLVHLAQRFQCIVFDRRECGQSGGRVEPLGWPDYVAQGRALLDHLGIERAHLMGGCMGCSPVTAFAVAHPERVERLILISPGSLEKDVRGRKTARPVPRAADVLILVTPRALARFLLASNYGDKSKVTEAGVNEWYEFWLREGNRRAMLDRLRQYVSGDVERTIAAVKVPVLLMWGEKNPRVPVALAYEFQKLLTGSPQVDLKILPGVGHMAVQEAPVETSRIVREYLDTAQTGAGARTSGAVSAGTPPPLPETPGS